jgi:hypothetical protein
MLVAAEKAGQKRGAGTPWLLAKSLGWHELLVHLDL